MALVNRSFSVNVTPGMMPPIVHVSEYDVGRAYTVSILDEQGNTFTIPSGTTASIEGTLNGSVGFTQSATVSNNQVSFTLSESMTAYSGKAWCKIKLTQNSQPIQTCAFVLAVDRAGVEAETVIGAPGFQEQINKGIAEYFDNDPPFFVLPSGGQSGQALLSDGEDGAVWGDAASGSGLTKQQFNNIIALFRAAIYDTSVLPNPNSVIDALEDSYDNIPATGISLSTNTLSFDDSTPKSVGVSLSPSNTTDNITASSSNSNVANVSVIGRNVSVTPVANGSATITIRAESGVYATASVTVSMPVQKTVTNNLTGCTTSNLQQTASAGRPYNATLTPTDSSYVFTTVTVTMGGTNITASAWNAATGAISIASVNGDIVITATAVSSVLYSLPAPLVTSGEADNYVNTQLKLGESNQSFTAVLYVKCDLSFAPGNYDNCAPLYLGVPTDNSKFNFMVLVAGYQANATGIGSGKTPANYNNIQNFKVVMRYDADTLTLDSTIKYFDQENASATNRTFTGSKTYASFGNHDSPVYIGKRSDSYFVCNNMTIQTVKVLNYKLTDDEIAAYIATEEAEV